MINQFRICGILCQNDVRETVFPPVFLPFDILFNIISILKWCVFHCERRRFFFIH